ncbi:MAG TPA: response regulator transcription factor [Candidatus Avidesulfovibrio excrementigallinarum]|nr:response regulator transcription factor [Candidatus Avidesulfovibrio excrementigallinarum]
MIYCVEDDRNIRELVVYTLTTTGFEARGFEDGAQLYTALEETVPALILLDIMLPGEDGLTILKKLRMDAATRNVPIIMLTARDSEYDKVTGLDSGADDYLAKPFGMMELISRIRAVLRRAAPPASVELRAGALTLNTRSRTVAVNGRPVELTLKEFELLQTLMRDPGTVILRDTLLERVWGYETGVETRTLDVHVRSLRQKLGPAGELLKTVRGVGYRLDLPALA